MNSTISNLTNNRQPILGISVGDPAGIGPEICAKIAGDTELWRDCTPIFLGDATAFRQRELPLPDLINIVPFEYCANFNASKAGPTFIGPTFIDFCSERIEQLTVGKASEIGGAAAFQYIETAIDWALGGKLDAIVTGPINKLALHMAEHDYPGHTEILATMTNTHDYCMMQYSDVLTCSFVTTHVGYAEVPQLLTPERILKVIQLSVETLRSLGVPNPKLVACGLNPHAGEDGLFGNREEENLIEPAIKTAVEQGIDIEGPFPSDTCFIPTRRATTDCFICMYHDQGHIPLKALAFDQAVNVTLGLPIVRTSVDHGTAFDIVGQNIADPSSLIHAVKLAKKLAGNLVKQT